MKTKRSTATYRNFGIELHNSTREYTCDGCQGEFPIPEDTEYGRVTVKKDGKLVRYRLCMRCALALQNKTAFSDRPIAFEPGSLKWNTLNSSFRKIWPETVDRMLKTKNQEERREVCDWMLRKLGIKLDEEAIMVEKEKKEARKARAVHREKLELARYRKKVEKIRTDLLALLSELGVDHLRETVAWTSNKPLDLKEAKEAYGNTVKGIIAKIDELSAEKTEEKTEE